MLEFSSEDIVAHRFTRTRRKGYDTLEVDRYLGRLAEHVGRMEAELDRLKATEWAALDTLQQAQHIAAETVAAARRDAEKLGQDARDGLENARKDALSMMGAARAEADKTLLAAQAQAEAAIETRQLRISELEVARIERTKRFDGIVGELSRSATQSATELRSTGTRLVEMAEHFEFRLATVEERSEIT
jgi:DivIVA domain-containing protein